MALSRSPPTHMTHALWRPPWCGEWGRSEIALFLKQIQPSKPVGARGFRPIICMSTRAHCDVEQKEQTDEHSRLMGDR
jgi:hypothetical protein